MKTIGYFVVAMMSLPMFGQVGIGTTTPQATLDIRNTNNANVYAGVLFPVVEEFAEGVDIPLGLVVYYGGIEAGSLKNTLYIYTDRGWKRLLSA